MLLKDRVLKAIAHKEATERWESSIPQIAEAAGVKVPSVHGWINGGSQSLRAGPAIKAAAFLGVNPLWLAEGEGTMIPGAPPYSANRSSTMLPAHDSGAADHSPLAQKIISVLRTIDEDGLKIVLDFAEYTAEKHPARKAKVA